MGSGQAENLTLSKLKFYMNRSVHAIIWKGERLSAAQYYRQLWEMFLGGDVQAVQILGLHNMGVPSAQMRPC